MMEGQVNQDNGPLPNGWHKHFDQQRKNWYYVNMNTSPPQITYTHPLGPNIPYSPPSHYGGPYGQAPAQAAVASQGVPQHHAPRYQEQAPAPYPSNPTASSIPGAPQSVSHYSNYETSNGQFPATHSAPYYSNPVSEYGEHSAYGYGQATESPSQYFPSPGYAGSYQAHPPKSNSTPEARMPPPNFPHYPISAYEEPPGQTHSSKTPEHAAGVGLPYPAHGASSGTRDPNSAGSAASKIPSAPGYGGSSSQVHGGAKSPVHMSPNSPQYPSSADEGQTLASKAPSRTTPSIPESAQYSAPGYGEASGQTTTKPAKSLVQPVPQYAESSGAHGQKQSKTSSPSILPYTSSPPGQTRASPPNKSPTEAAAAPAFPSYPAPGYQETHEQKPPTQPTPEFPPYPAPEYGDAHAQKPSEATTQSAGPIFPPCPSSGNSGSSGKTVDQKPAANTSVAPSFPQYPVSGYGGASEPAHGQKAAKSPKTTSPTPNISQSSGHATPDFPQYPAPGYESSNQVSKPAKSPAQSSNASPIYPSSHAEYSGSDGQAQAQPNGSLSHTILASQFPHYPAPSYGEQPRQAKAPKLAPSAPSFSQFPEHNDYQAPAGQFNAPKPSKSPPQPSSGSPNMPQYPVTGYEQQSSAPKPFKSPSQPPSGSPNMPQYPNGGHEQPPQFQAPPPAKSPSQAYPFTPAPSGLTMAQRLYSSSTKNTMSGPSTSFSHFPAQQDSSLIHTNPSKNSNDFNMPTAVAMSPQSQDYYANPAAQKPLHNSSPFGSHSSNSDHIAFPSHPSTNQTHHNYFESKPLPNEPLHRAQSYQAPAPPTPAQDFYHHRASTFTAGTKGNTTASTKPKPTPHLSMTARPPPQAHGTPQVSMFPGSMVPGSSGPLSPTLNQFPGQNAINSTMGYSSPPLPYASPTQFSPQAMYMTHPYQVPTYQPQAVPGQVPVARGFEENYNSTKKAIKKIGKKVLTKSNGETALKIANGVLFATTGIPAGLITSLGSALASHVIDSDAVNSIISSLTSDSDNSGNEDGSQLQTILQSLQSQPAADTGGVDYQAIVTALVQQYQQQAQEQAQKQAQQQAPPPPPAPVDFAALLAQFQANSISPPQQVAPAQAQTFNNNAIQDVNAMATLQMQQAMMEQAMVEQQMMLQSVASSDAGIF